MSFWKDFLAKFKLVDVQASLKTDQAGVVNIKVENNTYNLNFSNAEEVEKFKHAAITVDFEQTVKDEVAKRLEPFDWALSTLSPAVSGEVVAASTLATAIEKVDSELKLLDEVSYTVKRNGEIIDKG